MKLTDEQIKTLIPPGEVWLDDEALGDMLGFARTIESEVLRLNGITGDGRGEAVAWKHACNALCVDGLELWIDRCPHCGKPAPPQQQAAPVQDGYALAMAVLQSDLYHQLDDLERAQCDAMIAAAPKQETGA